MEQKIIKSFEQTISIYETLLTVSEQIYQALKTKEFQTLEELNAMNQEMSTALRVSLGLLKEEIQSLCQKKGLKEEKLGALLMVCEPNIKQKLMACHETAFVYEQKLKNNTKINQCLVETMMNCSQTVVDSWVHVSNKQNKKNTLINKKI